MGGLVNKCERVVTVMVNRKKRTKIKKRIKGRRHERRKEIAFRSSAGSLLIYTS